MGVVNVQGFFVLNEGPGLVVWEEGSLRPIMLIFYPSCQGLKQIRQMSGQVSPGSAGEYQADEPRDTCALICLIIAS